MATSANKLHARFVANSSFRLKCKRYISLFSPMFSSSLSDVHFCDHLFKLTKSVRKALWIKLKPCKLTQNWSIFLFQCVCWIVTKILLKIKWAWKIIAIQFKFLSAITHAIVGFRLWCAASGVPNYTVKVFEETYFVYFVKTFPFNVLIISTYTKFSFHAHCRVHK